MKRAPNAAAAVAASFERLGISIGQCLQGNARLSIAEGLASTNSQELDVSKVRRPNSKASA